MRAVALRPSDTQVTLTGKVPGVICAPTVHVHETRPLVGAVLSPRPAAATLSPALYITAIEQAAFETVCTLAVAFAPRFTAAGTLVKYVATGSGTAVTRAGGVTGVAVAVAVGIWVAVTVGVGAVGVAVAMGVFVALAVGTGVAVAPGVAGTLATIAVAVATVAVALVVGTAAVFVYFAAYFWVPSSDSSTLFGASSSGCNSNTARSKYCT